MAEQFKYTITEITDDKTHELYSDILDLWIDEIAGGYSGFEFVHQETTQRGDDVVTVHVMVKDDNGETHKVTHETVAKGLQLMLNDNTPGRGQPGSGRQAKTFYPSTGASAQVQALLLIVGEDDCGDIDAGDADCIVQLGVFGTLRYS